MLVSLMRLWDFVMLGPIVKSWEYVYLPVTLQSFFQSSSCKFVNLIKWKMGNGYCFDRRYVGFAIKLSYSLMIECSFWCVFHRVLWTLFSFYISKISKFNNFVPVIIISWLSNFQTPNRKKRLELIKQKFRRISKTMVRTTRLCYLLWILMWMFIIGQ